MLWYMIYNLVYAVIYDCDSMVLLDNFPFLISFVIKAKHLRTESVIGLRFSWSCIDLSLELRVLLLSKLNSLCSVCVCVWRRFLHFSNVFIKYFFSDWSRVQPGNHACYRWCPIHIRDHFPGTARSWGQNSITLVRHGSELRHIICPC